MDIVGKLRGKYWPEKTAREAIIEIGRLRIIDAVQQSVLESLAEVEEENKQLREALRELANSTYHSVDDYKDRAREALGEKE
jgi:hypothetical protein